MHDAETRALRRAVVILLAVSTARWAWAHTAESPVVEDDVLDALIDESAAALDEARARDRPLTADERIDPNRASEVELDRLPGVGPATARAIVAARESGVVFRRPEDLREVRGIGPSAVERLRPLVDLDAPPPAGSAGSRRSGAGQDRGVAAVVDLNRASPEELQVLPGIGPALAERIARERRKRMFTSLDDLMRVPGIGPGTVARLRGLAQAASGF
jgi:competence protein ComEA